MLVLTRRRNEWIKVGDLRIVVTDISPGRVKLGIEAPADVRVVRGELLERAAADKGAA